MSIGELQLQTHTLVSGFGQQALGALLASVQARTF